MLKELILIIRNLSPEEVKSLCLLISYYAALIAGFSWMAKLCNLFEEKEKGGLICQTKR